jgi:polysaccharide biosynthesis transport protein
MLQYQNSPQLRSVDNVDSVSKAESSSETIQTVLDFLSRRHREICISAAIAIFLAIIYLLTATPSYTAAASMLIDSNKIQLFQQQSMFSDFSMDSSSVESQVEVMRSENIVLAVIKQLHLTDDPEFVGSGGGLVGTLVDAVTGLFTSSEPDSEFALTRRAVNSFESRLNVRRVGLTYVLQISFRSLSPDRAAQVANAIADAYVDDQLEAKYQAAKRAGVWLQTRLQELREQATAAETAVVNYKNKNDMVDAGGRTINEQQLAELNSELVLAQSQTAEARAKMDRVQSILTSNSPDAAVDATVADTLKDDVINKLRSQYLELARRETDWSARYGVDHLAVVNLRNQMSEIQSSIRAELQRIAETYKSDFEVASQRETSVQKQLSQAVSLSQVNNKAQVSLRELQSKAESYQALYDNFLQRYMESVQQQSFPITDARVISAATRPSSKSNPKSTLVLALATILGLGFGVVFAAWREFADRVFRTTDQIETLLQTDCIGLIPALKKNDEPEESSLSVSGFKRLVRNSIPKIVPGSVRGRGDGVHAVLRRLVLESDKSIPTPEIPLAKTVLKSPVVGHQQIVAPPGLYSQITDAPLSALTEALRSVKMAVDLSSNVKGGKIIGFTSSVPNEGKSSIVSAVARLAAQTGAKTLLVDCDLRNPSLSDLLAPTAAYGLLEVLKGDLTVEKAAWVDRSTGLRFLPVSIPTLRRRLVHSSEILASEQTRNLLDSLRQSYNYIFLDFAPLMPIVDVRASTKLVDSYIYVIEWGQTRIDHVEHALRSAKGVYENLLGVVLNKVNLTALGRYDGHGSAYYHHENYHRYGYTE